MKNTNKTPHENFSIHVPRALENRLFSREDMALLLAALRQDPSSVAKEDKAAYKNIVSWVKAMEKKYSYSTSEEHLSLYDKSERARIESYHSEHQKNDDHYFNNFIEWIMLAYFEKLAKEGSGDFQKIYKASTFDDIKNGCDYIIECQNKTTKEVWYSALDLGNIASVQGFVGKIATSPTATPSDFFASKGKVPRSIPKSAWCLEPHFSYALASECLQSIMNKDPLAEVLEENFAYALESKELGQAQEEFRRSITEVPKTISHFSRQVKSILLNGKEVTAVAEAKTANIPVYKEIPDNKKKKRNHNPNRRASKVVISHLPPQDVPTDSMPHMDM